MKAFVSFLVFIYLFCCSSFASSAGYTCDLSVLDYGATRTCGGPGWDTKDDSTSFQNAIDASSFQSTNNVATKLCVPAGCYRVDQVWMKSNVNLQIDAGATIFLIKKCHDNSAIFQIGDNKDSTHTITNVIIQGVGHTIANKPDLSPVSPYPQYEIQIYWQAKVRNMAVLNMDPTAANCQYRYTGIHLRNTKNWAIQNLMLVNSWTNQETGAYPVSQSPAIALSADTGCKYNKTNPLYCDPHNGVIQNIYVAHSPGGFGAMQLQSCHNVTVTSILNEGGTAFRVETDAAGDYALDKNAPNFVFNSEVRDVFASDIWGVNCHTAVLLNAHSQNNFNVHAVNITVLGCANAVVVKETKDKATNKYGLGKFYNTSVTNVAVTNTTSCAEVKVNKTDDKGITFHFGPSDPKNPVDRIGAEQVTVTNVVIRTSIWTNCDLEANFNFTCMC